ncbi:MAG TPA: hypothetical protein PLG14_05725 [Spirochaetales bacterium]|nr:hypothetical protein [Spirochaetales bacterium]
MRLKYFFGVFLVAAISAAAVAMSGGKLAAFVDLPTYVVVLAIPAAIAFASWPVRDIGRAFSAPFDPAAGRKELEKSLLFFSQLRRWVLVAALLGTMIGLVCILAYADGRNLDRLGRNLAVMFLCVTNALLFCLVVPLPLESLASRRLAELE